MVWLEVVMVADGVVAEGGVAEGGVMVMWLKVGIW